MVDQFSVSNVDELIQQDQTLEIGADLVLTAQQRDELDEQIAKIIDDYQPIYEPFFKLKEEGQGSKPAIPSPVDCNDYDFIDKITCCYCMSTVYKPQFCSNDKCYSPICTACRNVLNKNEETRCLNCRKEF